MVEDTLLPILEELTVIHEDTAIPRNVRMRIRDVIIVLNTAETQLNLRVDRSLEELGAVAEDPNLPAYARTQLWSVLSLLESSPRN